MIKSTKQAYDQINQESGRAFESLSQNQELRDNKNTARK